VDPSGHFWGWFRKFIGAFIGAFIKSFIAVVIPFAGMFIGEFLGTLVESTINGSGIKEALRAAKDSVIGLAKNIGLNLIGPYSIYAAVRQNIDLALSVARGDWEGLTLYGARLAGAAAGNIAGNSVVEKIQSGGESTALSKSQGGQSSGNSNGQSMSGDEIAKNPRVRSQMEKAFKESKDNAVPEIDVRENGGWIKKGGQVERWPEGSSSGMDPTPKPSGAIGSFHTHPYGNDVPLIHQPSMPDTIWNQEQGVPGFIIDRQSIMRIEPNCIGTGCFHDVVTR